MSDQTGWQVESKIKSVEGPILVLGASGFVGANLFLALLKVRSDVYGTASRTPAWRLNGVPFDNLLVLDLLIESALEKVLEKIQPRTIFDCTAFGAYSFEQDPKLIYDTNFVRLTRLIPILRKQSISRYIHAGSSSEYGLNCDGPVESDELLPNSNYAVSKVAAAAYLSYQGRVLGFPCVSLRLYSVYGPLEDSSRLIPAVVQCAREGRLPEFVGESNSRDFVYVDDAVNAFIRAATELKPHLYGQSVNIGTGRKCTMRELASVAKQVFNLDSDARFTYQERDWDTPNWFANADLAREQFGWSASIGLEEGLKKTAEWRQTIDSAGYLKASKKYSVDEKRSISAVVVCAAESGRILLLYTSLKNLFSKVGVDHEIIIVNDDGNDACSEVIRRLSADDPRVMGISHSRRFGSPAAFMSGMEIATKNACVLIDADAGDPPELIEQFVELWRQGFDVVYGVRNIVGGKSHRRFVHSVFHRIFNLFSCVDVHFNACDFSLLDRRVVEAVKEFSERDLMFRGVRAFAGFRQVGVKYKINASQAQDADGRLIGKVSWAKSEFLSFSNSPLQLVSITGVCLFLITAALAICQVIIRLCYPEKTPAGVTTLLLAVMFFGSVGVLCTAVLGEYVAKIFEEVKNRPRYIRNQIIRGGEIRVACRGKGGITSRTG